MSNRNDEDTVHGEAGRNALERIGRHTTSERVMKKRQLQATTGSNAEEILASFNDDDLDDSWATPRPAADRRMKRIAAFFAITALMLLSFAAGAKVGRDRAGTNTGGLGGLAGFGAGRGAFGGGQGGGLGGFGAGGAPVGATPSTPTPTENTTATTVPTAPVGSDTPAAPTPSESTPATTGTTASPLGGLLPG